MRPFPTSGLQSKFIVAVFIACLAIFPNALALKKTVELESSDGKKITAELLEKSKDKVKLKVGRKIYTLLLEKLSKESAKIVRNANLPTICNFKLIGDFTKRSKIIRSHRTESDGSGGTRVYTSSYRSDTISGKITIQNRDNKDTSPVAQLYVAVLYRGKGGVRVMLREVKQVGSIEPLSESKFDVAEAKIWHSKRGSPILRPRGLAGRYYGYIAAIVIDGRIMEIKTMPGSYERNPEDVTKFLQIDQSIRPELFPRR